MQHLRRAVSVHGAAVLAVFIVIALWLGVPGLWGAHIPFSVFLLAVMIGGAVGGARAALLAAAMGIVASLYLGEPRYTFRFADASDHAFLATFVLASAMVAIGCARLRRTLEECRAAREALRAANLEIERRAHAEASVLEAQVAARTGELSALLHEHRQVEAERELLLASERCARAEAERASRLKDEFVATVSHELRTPLNAILGFSQLLQGQIGSAEKLARGLGVIERNARVLGQIVSDLLDTSRIVSGKLHVELVPVSLPLVVESALEGLRAAAEVKRVEIRVEMEPVDGEVRADAGRLQQAVGNLVSNAIKFTPAGGRVLVSLAGDDRRVVLRVRDTGQGIDPAFLPYVFDRFRQADASTSRAQGGLGLGLAIAKHVVDLHGGTIAVESAGAGRGAEFTVTLPAAPGIARARPRRRPAAAASCLRDKVVLVVDDEPDAREIAQRILEEHGARVIAVASASEALDALGGARPDVVVSDIGMPGMDGYELCRRIRKGADAPDVPAVALTAFARPEDREHALSAGFQAHVTKPVEPAELVATVAEACA